MKKNKYDKPMMQTAEVWANMSYCKKRKVGAVLAKKNKVKSTGYNGTLSGTNNECEEFQLSIENPTIVVNSILYNKIINQKDKYLLKNKRKQGDNKIIDVYDLSLPKRSNHDKVYHAEENIILDCAKNGIKMKNATIYVTTAPCKSCSKLLAGVGIKRIIYKDDYKTKEGIEYLKSVNVIVEKYSD